MARIMVVDDQEDWTFLLKSVFEKSGHEVIEANSGDECLSLMTDEKPDLIILDIMMNGMNGWEVCKQIKEDPTTSSIPICILSSYSNEEEIRKSFEYARADEHLHKSISVEGLKEAVSLLLSSPQTKNQLLRAIGEEKWKAF